MLAVVFTRVFDWIIPDFFFFFNPARFQPWVGWVSSRSTESGRVSKLWYLLLSIIFNSIKNINNKNMFFSCLCCVFLLRSYKIKSYRNALSNIFYD